jgi:hypothetical protein
MFLNGIGGLRKGEKVMIQEVSNQKHERLTAEELIMYRETVRQIIMQDLGMRKISSEMVPQILTDDQKHCQLHISSDLLHNSQMFDRVITGVEACCFSI